MRWYGGAFGCCGSGDGDAFGGWVVMVVASILVLVLAVIAVVVVVMVMINLVAVLT